MTTMHLHAFISLGELYVSLDRAQTEAWLTDAGARMDMARAVGVVAVTMGLRRIVVLDDMEEWVFAADLAGVE